jgi:hypothetical protein
MSAPVLPVDAAGSRARIDAGDLRQASRRGRPTRPSSGRTTRDEVGRLGPGQLTRLDTTPVRPPSAARARSATSKVRALALTALTLLFLAPAHAFDDPGWTQPPSATNAAAPAIHWRGKVVAPMSACMLEHVAHAYRQPLPLTLEDEVRYLKRALRIEQEARKSCDQLVLAMAVSR